MRRAWERLAGLCVKTQDYSGEMHARLELCQLPNAPFRAISDAVNRLNGLFWLQYVLDTEEKQVVGHRLADVMSDRISEADATDCSRLAWLCRHLGDRERARYFTEQGLARDLDNPYCNKLAIQLGIL